MVALLFFYVVQLLLLNKCCTFERLLQLIQDPVVSGTCHCSHHVYFYDHKSRPGLRQLYTPSALPWGKDPPVTIE